MAIELTHAALEHAFELLSDHCTALQRRHGSDMIDCAAMRKEVIRTGCDAASERQRNTRRETNLANRASNRLDELKKAEARVVELRYILSDRNDRVAELEKRIEYAMRTASGRWEEWGERAISVCTILEGGDPFEVGKSQDADQ